MVNSRAKGAAGEREWAAYLRERGHDARRGAQFHGGPDSPDVVCSIPGVHFEVKRVEKLNIRDAMQQAKNDAGTKIPIVAHRTNRQSWLVTLEADDLLNLLGPSHVNTTDCTGALTVDRPGIAAVDSGPSLPGS